MPLAELETSEVSYDRLRSDVQKCAAQHFGPWMVEPAWFERAVAAVKAGVFISYRPESSSKDSKDHAAQVAYLLTSDGIALISIEGQITKGESSFGGCSSVRARQALRQSVRDPQVKGIMLLVDSPGGTVAGTAELAADVAWAAAHKPLHAHVEDLCASAAYWLASQASRLTATATSLVGCIGTVAVVEDSSGQMAKEGVVVHVISTGPYKGAFMPGSKITEDQLAYLQGYVNDLNEHFLAGVAAGRRMSMDAVRQVADGRDHIAATARSLGLVDAVENQDQAMEALRAAIQQCLPDAVACPDKKETEMSLKTTVGAVVGAVVSAVTGKPAEPIAAVPAVVIAAEPAASEVAPAAAPAAAAQAVSTTTPAPAPAQGPAVPAAAEGASPTASAQDVSVIVAERLKQFTDAFGPAGATYLAQGKTFTEAARAHAAALAAELEIAKAENVKLKARVERDRGSPTPASFSPDAAGRAEVQADLAGKIGPNLARFAAGIVFAKDKKTD